MLVRMKSKIGGYRDGIEWPDAGDTIDVPDHEGHSLIANRYAEACNADTPSDPDAVPADVPDGEGNPSTDAVQAGDPTVAELAADTTEVSAKPAKTKKP